MNCLLTSFGFVNVCQVAGFMTCLSEKTVLFDQKQYFSGGFSYVNLHANILYSYCICLPKLLGFSVQHNREIY